MCFSAETGVLDQQSPEKYWANRGELGAFFSLSKFAKTAWWIFDNTEYKVMQFQSLMESAVYYKKICVY